MSVTKYPSANGYILIVINDDALKIPFRFFRGRQTARKTAEAPCIGRRMHRPRKPREHFGTAGAERPNGRTANSASAWRGETDPGRVLHAARQAKLGWTC